MNRENVSNKIAAGMDRWQNTLEDMINLRSSNNTVFKDYYWVSASSSLYYYESTTKYNGWNLMTNFNSKSLDRDQYVY